MKIRLRRQFKYMADNATECTLEKGEYEVPRNVDKDVAELALSFGAAVIVPEPKAKKKAPENKAKKVKETK